MVMSERIKEMVVERWRPRPRSRRAAREEGMLTLREAGLDKVRAGVTSIEEVARVASLATSSVCQADARPDDE